MRKKIIIGLCVAAVVCSCGKTGNKAEDVRKEKAKELEQWKAALRVGVTPTMDCLPVFIVKDSVPYDTTRLDLRLRIYNSHLDCDTALARGGVKGSATELVRAERLQRTGTALTYPISTDLRWRLVANKKARLKDISQFSDKMIAMTRFSMTDFLTEEVKAKAKLKYPLYKVQVNDVITRLGMILGNEMDAAWMTEPQATIALSQGHDIVEGCPIDSLAMGVIAFRHADMTTERDEEQIDEFIKAYDKACTLIEKNGTAHYSDIIRKYMGVTQNIIGKLPRQKYDKAHSPYPADLEAARRRLIKTKK